MIRQNKAPIWLPYGAERNNLLDKALEVVTASSKLEGQVPCETRLFLGSLLRLLNSYHSNLIEGHRTTLVDVQNDLANGLEGKDEERRYASHLCIALMKAEESLMERARLSLKKEITSPDFLCAIHEEIYSYLPQEHQYAHNSKGFTNFKIKPGQFRDLQVKVGDRPIGPAPKDIPSALTDFDRAYSLEQLHGVEPLVAMACAHHRLVWIHPFRDGNGRSARLFSGLYLAAYGINQSNLWSLSRGFSREKGHYMFQLQATDSILDDFYSTEDKNELLADFVDYVLDVCLDQISFMSQLLDLDQMEERIRTSMLVPGILGEAKIRNEAPRLVIAAFRQGKVERGAVSTVLGLGERTSRNVVRQLLDLGLLRSESSRKPLLFNASTDALPYFFPKLINPAIVGNNDSSTFRVEMTKRKEVS